MGKVNLNNIQVYAYHGCLPEEAVIGGRYSVDVSLETDFLSAAEKDDLSLTIDYVGVSEVVYREMAIRSRLIEQVAWRIGNALRAEFPSSTAAWVRVTKFAAPMPGQVESVSVELTV